MDALDYLVAGRFDEAVPAYLEELAYDGQDISAIAGLASAYMGLGNYRSAIPLMQRVHESNKRNLDHPGQHLYLAIAYWCLDDRDHAIKLVFGLCASILNRTVSMAPDSAGGATFGLILQYMAVTMNDSAKLDYALRYLKKLNVKYDKTPRRYRYPVATVKQLLGELSFEDALESATGERDLKAGYRAADKNRSIKLDIGEVLFHDGALRRANGDEVGCKTRMQEVFALGYRTEPVRWYLARHEVKGE